MSSSPDFVDYVVEQLSELELISYRKMFGEYALYFDNKVITLICDNQLYIKPTDAGRGFIKDLSEAPPYPGAKDYFLVQDHLDDRDWLQELVIITAQELPVPKPRKKKNSQAAIQSNGKSKSKSKGLS